jgi:hypothetical protein
MANYACTSMNVPECFIESYRRSLSFVCALDLALQWLRQKDNVSDEVAEIEEEGNTQDQSVNSIEVICRHC